MKRRTDANDTSSNKRQEVEYDVTFEKVTSCKISLGKVICSNEWRSKLRKTVSIMTQIPDTSLWNQSILRLFTICGNRKGCRYQN